MKISNKLIKMFLATKWSAFKNDLDLLSITQLSHQLLVPLSFISFLFKSFGNLLDERLSNHVVHT